MCWISKGESVCWFKYDESRKREKERKGHGNRIAWSYFVANVGYAMLILLLSLSMSEEYAGTNVSACSLMYVQTRYVKE